jgi:hypothetical protein
MSTTMMKVVVVVAVVVRQMAPCERQQRRQSRNSSFPVLQTLSAVFFCEEAVAHCLLWCKGGLC